MVVRSHDYTKFVARSRLVAAGWRVLVVVFAGTAFLSAVAALGVSDTTTTKTSDGQEITVETPVSRTAADAALIFAAISGAAGLSVWSARQAHDAQGQATAANDLRLRLNAIDAFYAPLEPGKRDEARERLGDLLFAQPTFAQLSGRDPTDPSLIAALVDAVRQRG